MAKTKTTQVTYTHQNVPVTFSGKKNKYEVCNMPINVKLKSAAQANLQVPVNNTAPVGFFSNRITLVPKSNMAGKRKVGKFTISLSLSETYESQIYWAIVYCTDQSAAPNWLHPESAESVLYKPSSAVLASGLNDTNAGPVRIYCPLFKNLNQNDEIFLITATVSTQDIIDSKPMDSDDYNAKLLGVCRYAICNN